MTRLRPIDIQALLDAVQKLGALRDLSAFPLDALAIVRAIVPGVLLCYNELNLDQRRAEVLFEPSITPLPRAAELLMEHQDEHPLVSYHSRTHDGQTLKISDFLSQRQFRQTGLYAEILRHVGGEDQMALVLPTSRSRIVAVAINRDHGRFTERDRLMLNLLRPHLAGAYERAQALSLLLQSAAEDRGQVLLVDRVGTLRLASDSARQTLAGYSQDELAQLQPWVQHLTQAEHGDQQPPQSPSRIVLRRAGHALHLRLIGRSDVSELLLIRLQERACFDEISARALGLTPREAEVLALLAEGLSDSAIAAELGVSRRTVEKHLEHTYTALGVGTRSEAVGMAFRQQVEPR